MSEDHNDEVEMGLVMPVRHLRQQGRTARRPELASASVWSSRSRSWRSGARSAGSPTCSTPEDGWLDRALNRIVED